jgi:PAS domain S-box-containing protein
MRDEPLISSGLYNHIFENSNDAVLILEHLRFTMCNAAALRLFNCTREYIIGKTLDEISFKQQVDGLSSNLSKNYIESALSGSLGDFEWIFRSESGNRIKTRVLVSADTSGNKNMLQLIVKERNSKNIPDIINESEIANLVLDIFPGLFFIYDITGGLEQAKLITFNRKWYKEKLGYSNAPAAFPLFFFSPSEEDRGNKILKDLKSSRYADFEINVRHHEGYDIPYLFVANLFETDSHVYFTSIGIDISERKYTEFALQQSEEYFKNIFNSSSDGIMVMDLDYKLLNANSSMLNMYGARFEDVAFQNVLDFLPESTRPILAGRSIQLLRKEPMPPIELELKKVSGEIIPIEINSIIITYGERTGILTTVRDLTERKTLEKQIFNSEILSEERERERFSKELHDGLGPILSTCKIYLHSLNEMLANQVDFLKISERALTLLDDALGSIKEISNNLSPHVLRNFGLVQAVIAFTHNLENISDLKFEVHYNYDQRLNEIIEFTAYRVITELINNSLKYAEATLIVIDINLKEAALDVSFSDNGKGFDPGTLSKPKRCFGLSNIETRISKFNGSYSYKTAPGKGVKVNFTLELNHSDK